MSEDANEILRVREEFFESINGIRNLSRNNPLLEHDPNFRIMIFPMIYALWERVFRISTAIAIKYKVNAVNSPNELPNNLLTLLLQKQGFFESFLSKIRNESKLNEEKIGKGQFDIVVNFLSSYDSWKKKSFAFDKSVESYVMTFSNVNEAVVRLHEDVLSSGKTRADSNPDPLDISTLGTIVGIRNAIGHGSLIQAPGERELLEIISFSEQLVVAYTDTMIRCVNQSNPSRVLHSRLRGYQKLAFIFKYRLYD
jgi:hypothetical protein